MQHRYSVHFIGILLLSFVLVPFVSVDTLAQSDAVLGMVNAERARIGAPMLVSNSQLRQAAQRHSNDMAAGDFLSHTGSDGSEFWQRIAATGYNMTTGAENVLYRWDASAAGAYDQWRNSPGHYNNMVNPAYLEVGIAMATSASGRFYFTMVLASRPGFSAPPPPTAVPPTDVPPPTAVPPTDVPPPTAVPPTDVPPPTAVPPTDVPPPTAVPPTDVPPPTAVPPTDVPPPTAVPPTDVPPPTAVPPTTSSSSVNPSSPTSVPPPSATALTSPVPPQPTITTEAGGSEPPVIEATSTAPSVAMAPPLQPDIDVNESSPSFVLQVLTLFVDFVAQLRTQITSVNPAPVAPAIPAPADAPELPREVRLVISVNDFSIINISGGPLFLEGLTFVSRTGELSIERWQSEYLSAPLSAFPRGGCLQVWTLDTNTVLEPPADCAVRHSWISVNDASVFWRGAEIFTVMRYGEAVAVCSSTQPTCEFNLDDRVPQPDGAGGQTASEPTAAASTARTQPTGSADVILVYSPDSFTLLNASGRAINLNGLGFSGPGGSLSVSSWQTDALSRPLNAFPDGGCLQAWSFDRSEWQPQPGFCDARHAWIAVNSTQTFWMDAEVFTVSYNGAVLATCPVLVGRCDFNLP